MFSQLIALLASAHLRMEAQRRLPWLPASFLQIQRKDLHTFDNEILDVWHVRENDIIARVTSDIEIQDSILLAQNVDDLITSSKR